MITFSGRDHFYRYYPTVQKQHVAQFIII